MGRHPRGRTKRAARPRAGIGRPWGPFRREFWRSPVRGPWLTAVLSAALFGFLLVFVTGLVSYAAYNPGLRGANTDFTPDKGGLGFYLFAWPTQPSWLYWLNQGIHVVLGLVLVPVLLAKLWSVLPKLFQWPPVVSFTHLLERLTLLLLVGGAGFEVVTGVLDIQYWYVFPGSFYRLHFYGAWIFAAALAVHVVLKSRHFVAGLRRRSLRRELRAGIEQTTPEALDEAGLVTPNPAPPTISRRGVLGLVGAASVTMFAVVGGEEIAGRARAIAVLAPRGQRRGDGPNDFQINKTAAYRGIARVGPRWRLELRGMTGRRRLSYAELHAMPQHTEELPIACVEGWSTGVQRWRGVRLADIARLVGGEHAESVFVESLQHGGAFGSAALRANQVRDPRSLLALEVNGAALSLDHGFPARIIVPAAPGVHNTKWVSRMTFRRNP